MKTMSARIDTSTTAVFFGDSFTDDSFVLDLEDSTQEDMDYNWIHIEDDIDILEKEVEEALEKLNFTDDAGIYDSDDEDKDI